MTNKLAVNPGTTKSNKTGAWRTFTPIIDENQCIACGTCVLVCPESATSLQSHNNKKYAVVDLTYCKGCGICAKECPVKCIIMK